MPTFNGFKQAFARERLTVNNTTVKSLTAATYLDSASNVDLRQKASGARVTVETAPIRFTEDGSTPVITGGSEVGTLAQAGDVIYLDGYNSVRNFRAKATTATDAYIEVTYYR